MFLHSWANPDHEAAVGAIIAQEAPLLYRSLSHEILREYREFERTSTTVLNAYVGPRVKRYLGDLENLLAEFGFGGRLLIMQSNGGTMTPETAKRVPVNMMESGPVGGIIAAAEVSGNLGYKNVLAFDMGGTTAKVSLVQNSEPSIAQGYYIGGLASGHPVMLPVVDIIEVGTGGGHRVDRRSRRAQGRTAQRGGHPGPVCYGQGGTAPTVTDANVILGRLSPSRFLGGRCRSTSRARAKRSATIAEPLDLTVEAAALGIIRSRSRRCRWPCAACRSTAVTTRAISRWSVSAAPALALGANRARIARADVDRPRVPGHFSALGMLMSDPRHDYVRVLHKSLAESDFDDPAHLRAWSTARALAQRRHGGRCDGVPVLPRHPLRRSGISDSDAGCRSGDCRRRHGPHSRGVR